MSVSGHQQEDNEATLDESDARLTDLDGAVADRSVGVVEIDERRIKMERLRAEGIDPYPAVTLWGRRTRIAEILGAHDPSTLDQGAHPDMRYLIAGRLISRRGHGKTAF